MFVLVRNDFPSSPHHDAIGDHPLQQSSHSTAPRTACVAARVFQGGCFRPPRPGTLLDARPVQPVWCWRLRRGSSPCATESAVHRWTRGDSAQIRVCLPLVLRRHDSDGACRPSATSPAALVPNHVRASGPYDATASSSHAERRRSGFSAVPPR